jgi:hypothetical protein
MLSTLRTLPLLALPLAIFVLISFAVQGYDWTHAVAITLKMFSGADWAVSLGDLFVLTCLVVLFIEVVKAVNTNASEIVNHGLSMLIAVVCLVLFMTWPHASNSTFFLLTVMGFFDVAAGLTITIVSARRDFGTSQN